MSATAIHCPEATGVPSRLNVPTAGKLLILIASKALAVLSLGSLKPTSATVMA